MKFSASTNASASTCSASDNLEVCCSRAGYGCGIVYPPVSSASTPTQDGQT